MEPAVLASFAVALVVFGVVSRRMERGVVSPPMVFVGLGFALRAARVARFGKRAAVRSHRAHAGARALLCACACVTWLPVPSVQDVSARGLGLRGLAGQPVWEAPAEAETPADRGHRLVDALIVLITPDRQLGARHQPLRGPGSPRLATGGSNAWGGGSHAPTMILS